MVRRGSMEKAEPKSLRPVRPRCPQCYSGRTQIDWSAIGNLLRLPGAALSGMACSPVLDIRMRCSECGDVFLASRDEAEAGHWEPITEQAAAAIRADSA